MKKITLGLFAVLLVTALAASLALAEPCPTMKTADAKNTGQPCPSATATEAGAETPAKTASLEKCCMEAALSGMACGDMTAEQVKAAAASCPEVKAVKAEMKACCAEALDAGKGCCGVDAEGLKTGFAMKVMGRRAAERVKAEMHPCCAEALGAGKGCCGKDAEALKADFNKKVKTEEKKLASS